MATQISVSMKCPPKLDPQFVPAALWNKEYRKAVAADANKKKIAIVVERTNGSISRFDTEIFAETTDNLDVNLYYVERIVKFLLWAYGGWKVIIGGSEVIAKELEKIYSPAGIRAFDYDIMGKRIYNHKFTVEYSQYENTPAENEFGVEMGKNFDGCRIGFDLGGSDRKCAAVIDGKVVHSEEVVWDPYYQKDINYHREGIIDSLRRAAAHLPRVDAIGGSAAGVYVDNQPRIASLFRGIATEEFEENVCPLFIEIAKEFNAPIVVVNDGEVTALAGAISMEKNKVLGLAMGTSEAVGYVDPNGNITDHLNELAFAPIDYRCECTSPRDEWSGDVGVGAAYLSQQAVGRLSTVAGFDFPEGTPFPEQLKMLQSKMSVKDPRAVDLYQTIGCYLGYALAHYADFYEIGSLLLLGRVSSGEGGDIIVSTAQNILKEEFPNLEIEIALPDEKFRRHGQAVIAASLPKL